MKLDSKNLVLNLLGQDSNIQINKKVLLTLGLEEAFFLSYLIDQYRYFDREGRLREDGSFYATNMDISLYTTLNDSQITRIKKSGIEKELFCVSLEESRTKSFYKLNFDKILELIGTEKSNLELAYKKIYNNENLNFKINSNEDIENLKKFTFKELRYFCKENKISYKGSDKKENLILKIVEEKNPSLLSTIQLFEVNENSFTSERKKCSLRKNDTSRDSVSENTLTVSVNSMTNQEQINQEQISCHERDLDIENLFKNLGINYTDTNVVSSNKILEKLNGNKNLLIKYIDIFYQNLQKTNYQISNLPGLFSLKFKEPNMQLIQNLLKEEKAKEERQIKENQKNEEENKKIIEEENKKEEINNNFYILEKLEALPIEKKEKIIEIAEKKAIQENPEKIEVLKLYKETCYRLFLMLLIKNIKSVIEEV